MRVKIVKKSLLSRVLDIEIETERESDIEKIFKMLDVKIERRKIWGAIKNDQKTPNIKK